MLAKDLKSWMNTLDDKCVIEIKGYTWDELEVEKIRATYVSHPERTLADTNNLEQCT